MDAEGSQKNFYRPALIAMSFFAVLFFIILIVILAVWCKKRRQTEVKTVVITPKKRPVSTKVVKQANGGREHTNGNADVEAGAITADEIELSDDQEETNRSNNPQEMSADKPSNEDIPETEQMPQTDKPLAEEATQPAAVVSQETGQGEVNPSFQKEDEDDAPPS